MKYGCFLSFSLFTYFHEYSFELWKMKYLKMSTLFTINLMLEEGWHNFLAGIMQTKEIFGLEKRKIRQNE